MKALTAFLLVHVLCHSTTESSALPAVKGCVQDGKTYQVGENFRPTPCQYCTCGADGRVMCAIMDCAMPPCMDAVSAPDQCCPVCPNGPNCRAPDGSTIQEGKNVTLANGAICSCPIGGSNWGHWGHWNQDALCALPAPTVNIRVQN